MYPYNIKENDLPKRTTDKSLIVSDDAQTVSEMLADAINDEAGDFSTYAAIAEIITDSSDSETVKSMSYDEFKHKRIFEEIYNAINGSLPESSETALPTIEDLSAALSDCLFSELEAVEMYRELMSAFESTDIRDMIFEVITNEQAHADILNYLIAKIQE